MPQTSGRDEPELDRSALDRGSFIPPPSMDLLKELRLRRWARQNYVPQEDRSDRWDPLILDEMRRRDDELAAEPIDEIDDPLTVNVAAAAGYGVGTMLVPLEPMTYALDPPHLGPGPPHFLSMPIRETVSDVPDWGYYFG